MKNQYGWQGLNQNLLVCIYRYTRSRWRGHGHWLRIRDALKSLPDSVNLFTLQVILLGDSRDPFDSAVTNLDV